MVLNGALPIKISVVTVKSFENVSEKNDEFFKL